MQSGTSLAAKHAALTLLQNSARLSEQALKLARITAYEPDEKGFVSFGDMARAELGQQCQYASRYVYGTIPGYPNIGEGLRFDNYEMGRGNYHSLKIHIDDTSEFVSRYRQLK